MFLTFLFMPYSVCVYIYIYLKLKCAIKYVHNFKFHALQRSSDVLLKNVKNTVIYNKNVLKCLIKDKLSRVRWDIFDCSLMYIFDIYLKKNCKIRNIVIPYRKIPIISSPENKPIVT